MRCPFLDRECIRGKCESYENQLDDLEFMHEIRSLTRLWKKESFISIHERCSYPYCHALKKKL